MTRRGRRPANPQTRAAVLAVALDAFAQRGFRATTIRQIAATAEVDPALVHYFFGTKHELFLTVLTSSLDTAQLLSQLLEGDIDELGERLVARFLRRWEDGAGATAAALLRTAVTEARIRDVVRQHVIPAVAEELAHRLSTDAADARTRAILVASQLSGVVITRYVLCISPIAEASIDWIATTIGPTIQHYLTAPLPAPPGRCSIPPEHS